MLAGPATVAIAALLGAGLAIALARTPPPSIPLVLLVGIGGLGGLALVLARYEAAAFVGFVLLGFVNIEPAPADLVFATLIVVAAATGRFDVTRAPPIILGSLGALLALNVLSATQAIDPGEAALFAGITIYLAVFALWLAGYVSSARRARWLVLGYLVAALASAAIGLLALLALVPGHEDLLLGGERVKGLFKDPNVFGPFMIPIGLILLEETVRPRLLRLPQALKVAILVVLALAVLFSFSRAAWLNAAVGVAVLVAVLVLRRGSARRVAAMVGILVAAAVVVGIVVGIAGSGDLLGERAQVQAYDSERFAAQEAGVELANSYPIGAGPGQYTDLVGIDAHSLYVRALVEQGFAGLAALIVLATATLGIAARSALRGHHVHGIGSAALLAAWVGLLANSLFVDTIHWRHLWLVAALIWVGARWRSAPGAPQRRGPMPHRTQPPGIRAP